MNKTKRSLKLIDDQSELSEVVNEITEIDEVVSEMKKQKSSFNEVVREILSVVKDPVIAGGLAVSFYDKTRATMDMDFVGMVGIKQYARDLQNIGFRKETVRLPGLMMEMFTKGKHGADFMAFENQEFEKTVISRAIPSSIYGHKVRIVSLEDLIIMKKMSSRTKDKADLEGLEKLKYDSIYVDQWMSNLKIK